MSKIQFSLTPDNEFSLRDVMARYADRLSVAHQSILDGTCPGAEMLGWRDWPATDHTQLLDRINSLASRIRAQAEVLVVIGIGGSWLGGQAGLEFVRGTYYNQLTTGTQVIFVGQNLSASSWREVCEYIGEREWAINVISKSGTTLEPALAFGFFQAELVARYGAGAAERIYATTDANTGLLHDQAVAHGWERLEVPDDIGGRFSALTSVGLLPWAVAGIDVAAVLAGARQQRAALWDGSADNPAWQYAAVRHELLARGKNIELMATYEPRLRLLSKWWQQLFGESEGKTARVIFPATLELTADLHSLGQYLQQGQKFLFETVWWLDQDPGDEPIRLDENSSEAFPFLAGKSVGMVADVARQATAVAHTPGGIPNLLVRLPQADEATLGAAMYWAEFACALSALMLGVNPFDQPGVQAYKDEMMRRLRA